MVLTEEKVRALAAIARLGITEEELTALTIALNRTCQYIAEIREAPVPEGITEAGGEPTNTDGDQYCPLAPGGRLAECTGAGQFVFSDPADFRGLILGVGKTEKGIEHGDDQDERGRLAKGAGPAGNISGGAGHLLSGPDCTA